MKLKIHKEDFENGFKDGNWVIIDNEVAERVYDHDWENMWHWIIHESKDFDIPAQLVLFNYDPARLYNAMKEKLKS